MDDDAARHISREGLAALEAELRELETEGRRAIADRIRTAREWGDLKENAEYHDAKEARSKGVRRERGGAPGGCFPGRRGARRHPPQVHEREMKRVAERP